MFPRREHDKRPNPRFEGQCCPNGGPDSDATAETGFETDSLTSLDWAALDLAGITGVIYLSAFTTEDWLPFLLAGLGFFGAIGLFLFNVYRYLLYPLGILYTAAPIVGYLLVPLGPLWLGILGKVVQVTLVAILAYRFSQVSASRRR